MGAPKKQRKKYSTVKHPWQKARIEEEAILLREYGLKNKTEIYKMRSILKGFADQATNLITSKTKQAEKERIDLLNKLSNLGLITKTGNIDDVLDLSISDIMDRRLQTLVYKKAMTRSIKQARQFIVHEHINVGNKKITTPSYLVPVEDEPSISFIANSKLADLEHPEREVLVKKPKKPKKTSKRFDRK
ncbi:30S ribosomal protein S4 [Candidatus Woesearchaeota archaeon CG_4_10_14_0_2_um_filter_33_10]|nr:MAG: 30S ribosomal protein S4 [Candidatus Woesearchaeota archaeon CG1_02_33_12]PIN77435.1 MAG: 30S ribosomal protein S4 [Candidatus Woesearchaeota archaeon CG10_big_fil_rev_8_21_14_0_10_33_12]PIU72640.1 MAG: 30S ribosomal protein S4 [Candidatus Woesearchaeota archaeon CG06_land_8_20_14_3_00_33_13]PIZ52950.1 MAG: 30S ribosomal protein S4 [Candidatus Woesearchaeota archaeon CG_4_10_14_0_2_um_filter_33_10]